MLDIFPHKLEVTTDVLIISKQLRKYYEYFKILIGGKNISNNLQVPMGALLTIPSLDFLLMWVLQLQHHLADESPESDSKLFFKNTYI